MEEGVAARGRLNLLRSGSWIHGGLNAHLCKTITGCANETTHGPLPGVDRESSDPKSMRRLLKDAQDANMGSQRYLGDEKNHYLLVQRAVCVPYLPRTGDRYPLEEREKP